MKQIAQLLKQLNDKRELKTGLQFPLQGSHSASVVTITLQRVGHL